MDDPEIYFLHAHQLPPCPGDRLEGCRSLTHAFMILIKQNYYYYIFFYATCRDIIGWPTALIPFFEETTTCHFLDGSRRFTDPTSVPYK